MNRVFETIKSLRQARQAVESWEGLQFEPFQLLLLACRVDTSEVQYYQAKLMLICNGAIDTTRLQVQRWLRSSLLHNSATLGSQ